LLVGVLNVKSSVANRTVVLAYKQITNTKKTLNKNKGAGCVTNHYKDGLEKSKNKQTEPIE